MKKRYLAMLMAVLMCFGLLSAGALAGEAESGETESFTAFAAPSGETEAATEETTEEPAGEPQPLDGEGEGGTTPTTPPAPQQPKDITEEPTLAYAYLPISADGVTGLFGEWTMGLEWTEGDVIDGTTLVGAMWYDPDTGLCTPLSEGQSVSFTDADGDGKAESLTFDIGRMAPGEYWFVITYDIPGKGLYRGPKISLVANEYKRECWGVAVAGYGGVVTYWAPSTPLGFAASAWEKPDRTVVETIPGLSAGYEKRQAEDDRPLEPGEDYWLKVSVGPTVPAGTYRFNAGGRGTSMTYSLTVYEPGKAEDTEYQGFDVLKFAWENGEQKPLAGAVFAVYTAEWGPDAVELEPVEQIATYTTDENGLIHVDPKDFGDDAPSPEDTSSRLYILREISAPEGYRASDEAWGFEGSTWWEASGDGRTANLVVSVAPPMGEDYDDVWLNEQGVLEVYNEPLTSVSIDVEKTVTAKNGAQPGKNTFTFELTAAIDEDDAAISVYFTPEGGARQKLSYTGQTIDMGSFSYEQRVYRFSLTVNGAGTAKGVLTIEGTRDELHDFLGEIREKASGVAGWQYDNRLGGISIYSGPVVWALDTDGAQEYAADDIEVELWLDEPQAGRPEGLILDEDDDEFGHIGDDVYYLYEGVWYKAVYLAAGEPLHFVNVYAGAAPAAKAVPTGDGARPLAWMLLALTAAAAAAVILLRRKTEE